MYLFKILVFVLFKNVFCFKSPYPDDFSYTGATIDHYLGIYYLVVSQKNNIEISFSRDLVDWTPPQEILTTENQDSLIDSFNSVNLYITEEEDFLVYFQTSRSLGVAKSLTFAGLYKSSILTSNYSNKFDLEDPSVLYDNGTLVLYYVAKSSHAERSIESVFMNDDGLSLSSKKETIIRFPEIERNTNTITSYRIFEKDGMFYCLIGGKVDNQFFVGRSEKKTGPFIGDHNIGIEEGASKVYDTFKTRGNDIYVLYRSFDKKGTFAKKLSWRSDGWPEFEKTTPPDDQVDIEKRMDYLEGKLAKIEKYLRLTAECAQQWED